MNKKTILILTLIVFSFNVQSQIIFEKGYFIDKTDTKIDCLIKNIDWKDSPKKIEYKTSENGELINIDTNTLKEFGIYNISKYVKNTVKIDKSLDNFNNLTFDKNPELVEETLFLKVLVEGKSNLYLFTSDNLQRFFYNKDNSTIEQLIYKRYYASKDTISHNNHYKQRLWNDLKCSKIKISDIEKLDYTQKSLIPFFVSYNKCNNNDNNNEVNKIKKDLFNLNLRAHLNNISATDSFLFNNDNASNFGNKQSVGIGLEAEFIYPFKKNKWSLIVEPNFKKINTTKSLDASNVSGGKLFVTYNFNLIEIPVGIRHYLFLNKNSKIFVNASYIFNGLSKTTIELKRADNSIYNIYTSKSPNNFGLGLGYNFKDKYSLELRYHSRKNLLNDYSITSFEISTISLMLGYSIF